MKHHQFIIDMTDPKAQPIPVTDPTKWAKWFEEADRSIRLDHVIEESINLDITISTVFVGTTFDEDDEGRPLLWETLVDGPYGSQTFTYASRAQAESGHSEHQATAEKMRVELMCGEGKHSLVIDKENQFIEICEHCGTIVTDEPATIVWDGSIGDEPTFLDALEEIK